MSKKEEKLDWDYLFDILNYNSETGIFTNKITRSSRAVKGAIAGNLEPSGYIRIAIDGEKYQAHRLAWFYEYAKWPKDLIDHKNRIKHQNWISNLREATHSENSKNNSTNKGSSKYRGVRWDRGKWKAQIESNRTYKHLGRFNNELEAAEAYNIAAIKYHGEFANLNKL